MDSFTRRYQAYCAEVKTDPFFVGWRQAFILLGQVIPEPHLLL